MKAIIKRKQWGEKEGVKKEVGTAAVRKESENVQKGGKEIGKAMAEDDQLFLEALRCENSNARGRGGQYFSRSISDDSCFRAESNSEKSTH